MNAIRLTFDVIGKKLTFRSATRLQMRVPPEQKFGNMGTGAGLWLEVRDARGTPIYQRVVDAEILQPDTEIRTGAADRPFARRSSDAINTTFNAVIPDDPRGASFHILERRAGDASDAPTELVQLDLANI